MKRDELTDLSAFKTRKQLEHAQELGLMREEIEKAVAAAIAVSLPIVKKLFVAAGVETLRYDNEIYKEAGIAPIELKAHPKMLQVIKSGTSKANASIRRLTGTIAINSEDMFERHLNNAYASVATGQASYTEALNNTIDELAKERITHFDYASGKRISTEAAVLMNIRTGIAQTAAEVTKLGIIERECAYVEVSAHNAARYHKDEDFKSHVGWQGKVFHWKQLDKGEKPLTNTTNTDIINAGATNAALNSESEKAQKHAEQYYEAVRNMKTDYIQIAKNTDFSEENVLKIKNYLFVNKHNLSSGYKRFDPHYDIAQAWQRLIDGKHIKEQDIVLLRHEYMELNLVESGIPQDEAHIIASKEFNFAKYIVGKGD